MFLCGCFVSLTHLYPPKSNSWLRLSAWSVSVVFYLFVRLFSCVPCLYILSTAVMWWIKHACKSSRGEDAPDGASWRGTWGQLTPPLLPQTSTRRKFFLLLENTEFGAKNSPFLKNLWSILSNRISSVGNLQVPRPFQRTTTSLSKLCAFLVTCTNTDSCFYSAGETYSNPPDTADGLCATEPKFMR